MNWFLEWAISEPWFYELLQTESFLLKTLQPWDISAPFMSHFWALRHFWYISEYFLSHIWDFSEFSLSMFWALRHFWAILRLFRANFEPWDILKSFWTYSWLMRLCWWSFFFIFSGPCVSFSKRVFPNGPEFLQYFLEWWSLAKKQVC